MYIVVNFCSLTSLKLALMCFILSGSLNKDSFVFYYHFSQVYVESDGVPVASSPFVVRVGDPGKVQVAHVRSEELFAERVIKNEVDLAVEGSNDMNYDDFTAQVTSPDGENVPCIVNKGTDDRVHVKFTPHKPGPYKVKAGVTGD